MPAKITTNNPERKEILDDNARKFIIETLDPRFLETQDASSSILIVDWLETGENNETKVVHKKFDNGDVQTILVTKVTKDGNRTSEKKKITEEKYKGLLALSKLHLKKKRYEFEYNQNGILFSVKYDEFADDKLTILEVDASSEVERNSFSPDDFPGGPEEVTGDIRYYGYRVAEII